MKAERWRRIMRVMDEAFADYLTGMAALRNRVVGDVKRKLSDSQVLTVPIWNIRDPESDRLRRRDLGVREGSALAAEVPPCRHRRKGWRLHPTAPTARSLSPRAAAFVGVRCSTAFGFVLRRNAGDRWRGVGEQASSRSLRRCLFFP